MQPQSVDSAFLQYLIGKTLAKSASVHLLFAFEYIIQVPASQPPCFTLQRLQLQSIDDNLGGAIRR